MCIKTAFFCYLDEQPYKKFYKQMESDEFDGEVDDIELMIELWMFSATPLVVLTGDIQKDFFTEELSK